MVWSKKRAPSRPRNSRDADSPTSEIRHAGGVVTSVALQQRSHADRVNVFLDGEYAFSLAATIAAPLRQGQQLQREDVQRLVNQDAAERAYERALSFLTARPRSKAEVRRRLAEADLPPQAIDAALERLDQGGLVNDEEFASYWVTQRQTFHPRGPRALRAELRTKGIDADTVAT